MKQMYSTNAMLVHHNGCGPRSAIQIVKGQINFSEPISKNQRKAVANTFTSGAALIDHGSHPKEHRKDPRSDFRASECTIKATFMCFWLCTAAHHANLGIVSV